MRIIVQQQQTNGGLVNRLDNSPPQRSNGGDLRPITPLCTRPHRGELRPITGSIALAGHRRATAANCAR